MAYTLNIAIDEAGIALLNSANLSVAMLQASSNSQYLIVAVLAGPAESMQITWQNMLCVYTSGYPLQAYQILKINNSKTAESSSLYSYNGTQISFISQAAPQGSLQLENQDSSGTTGSITAGLANTFTVNGSRQPLAILTAEALLYNGTGTLLISNSYYLTVLSNSSVGMVIPAGVITPEAVSSHAANIVLIAAQPSLLIDFSQSSPTQSVTYDDQLNEFVFNS
jgi:hypothetical protein